MLYINDFLFTTIFFFQSLCKDLERAEVRKWLQQILEILMAEGAPGKPGMHVLKADTSDHGPRPQVLMAATRNLYAVPGWKRSKSK